MDLVQKIGIDSLANFNATNTRKNYRQTHTEIITINTMAGQQTKKVPVGIKTYRHIEFKSEKTIVFNITEVQLREDLDFDIWSFSKVNKEGVDGTLRNAPNKRSTIRIQNMEFQVFHQMEDLYFLFLNNRVEQSTEKCLQCYHTCTADVPKNITPLQLLHMRFGHANYEKLKILAQSEVDLGFTVDNFSQKYGFNDCEACNHHIRKTAVLPSNKPIEYGVGEFWVFDDIDLANDPTPCGYKYVRTAVCRRSKVIMAWLLKEKTDASVQLLKLIENCEQRGWKVKAVRRDLDGGYVSAKWDKVCKDNNIIKQPVPKERHEGGTAVENTINTIRQLGGKMHKASGLPKDMIGFAYLHAAYLLILLPKINGEIPSQLFDKEIPEALQKHRYKNLRTWGCIGYALLPTNERRKTDPPRRRGIYVGHENMDSSRYKMYDPISKQIFYASSVRFVEKITTQGKLVNLSPVELQQGELQQGLTPATVEVLDSLRQKPNDPTKPPQKKRKVEPEKSKPDDSAENEPTGEALIDNIPCQVCRKLDSGEDNPMLLCDGCSEKSALVLPYPLHILSADLGSIL
mmetsp:Transcript_18162/g.61776  ORF Transcript_18162/g.61776 Transcript_18162/m.61776 type:complete len:572 (+) Transcript_18162:1720-3435(+)